MAVAQASIKSSSQFNPPLGLVAAAKPPTTILTPGLVLAVSLLYMMSSDGQIEDKEASQLQAVMGSNEALLNFALAYVQRVSVESFLDQAPGGLSKEDKLCILTNVCDSMLSDGRCEPSELLFFETLLSAFGISTQEYKPYFQAIQLKNDKTVLGPFADLQAGAPMTPHLALAVCLLYMMSADGRLSQEEIGQFETVVREFEGLQQAAIGYVRTTKREDFFKTIRRVLDRRQQLCLLTHVCDSMMSDGVVAVAEYKLFLGIMSVFDWHIADFNKFNKVLEVKNIKPFDIRKFEISEAHLRAIDAVDAESEVFAMANNKAELGIEVRRTLHDTTETMQHDVGTSENLIQVHHNATDDLNTQWLVGAVMDPNQLSLDLDANNVSRVRVDTFSDPSTVQFIDGTSPSHDAQRMSELRELEANYQTLSKVGDSKLMEILPPEVRIKNLFGNIEVLTQRLDDFETKNKLLLDTVKKANILHNPSASGADNFHQSSASSVPSVDVDWAPENQQTLKWDALDANRQKLAQPLKADKPRSFEGMAAERPNARTGLGKTHVQSNMQSVGVPVMGSNHPMMGQVKSSSNWQHIAPSEVTTHLDLTRPAANSPFHADDVAEPMPTTGKGFERATQTPSDDTSQTQPAGSEATGWARTPTQTKRVNPESRLSMRDLMLCAKLVATFCMLSMWSPSTNAMRSVNPRVVTGQLVRLHQVPLVEVELDTLSEIKTAD